RARIARDLADLAGTDREHLAVQALDLRGAGAHAEPGRVLGRAGLDVIITLFTQRDRAARGDDLVGRVGVEREGLDVDATAVDLQAGLDVVDGQHVQLRGIVHADAGAGDREFASGVGFGPDRITRGERRVDHGRTPVGLLI